MKFRNLAFTFITAACIAASSSSFATSSWTFTGTSNGVATVGGTPNLTASGVYAANGGTFNSSGGSGGTYGISGFASGATWTSNSNSNLAYYAPSGGQLDGLGMSSDGSVSPDHAIDNGPAYNSSGQVTGLGNTEAVLLSFSSKLALSSITTGFVSGDSDFSVFEWTGSSAPTLAGASVGTTSNTSTGWQLVGNYDGTGGGIGPGVTGDGGTTAVNSGGASSSWWLISAYNNSYGSACANCAQTGGSILQGNDYFKLYQVAGATPAVTPMPEPSSIALVGVALFGVVAARRRLERKSGSTLNFAT